jgi:YfiH family protein
MNISDLDTLLLRKQWRRSTKDGITFHQSSVLAAMPGLAHGFTARQGGCSTGPYKSLNLGKNVGDLSDNVEENRRRVAAALGFSLADIVDAEQVHGSRVAVIDGPGGSALTADALIANRPNILLMLMFADCVPVFLFDPYNRAIGLVHSGWRGTDKNVVQSALNAMTENYGTDPARVMAAIGPCIGFDRYEVSLDVAERFRNTVGHQDSGAAQVVLPFNEFKGTYLLNLRQVIFQQLVLAGLRIESVIVSDQCTVSNTKDFYSHRRDGANSKSTGRMAAVIGLKSLNRIRGNR